MAEVPSLETFKIRPDKAASSLVLLKVSLLIAEKLDYMTFKGPTQTKLFYILSNVYYCQVLGIRTSNILPPFFCV